MPFNIIIYLAPTANAVNQMQETKNESVFFFFLSPWSTLGFDPA